MHGVLSQRTLFYIISTVRAINPTSVEDLGTSVLHTGPVQFFESEIPQKKVQSGNTGAAVAGGDRPGERSVWGGRRWAREHGLLISYIEPRPREVKPNVTNEIWMS
jgi:hypothetical protein